MAEAAGCRCEQMKAIPVQTKDIVPAECVQMSWILRTNQLCYGSTLLIYEPVPPPVPKSRPSQATIDKLRQNLLSYDVHMRTVENAPEPAPHADEPPTPELDATSAENEREEEGEFDAPQEADPQARPDDMKDTDLDEDCDHDAQSAIEYAGLQERFDETCCTHACPHCGRELQSNVTSCDLRGAIAKKKSCLKTSSSSLPQGKSILSIQSSKSNWR